LVKSEIVFSTTNASYQSFLSEIGASVNSGASLTALDGSKITAGTLTDSSLASTSVLSRMVNGSIISAPLSIYISAATGNNSNTGTTSGTALATFTEFIRRYGINPIVSAPLDIIFLDATVAEDVFFFPIITTTGHVRARGTRTAVANGTGTFTTVQTRSKPSRLAVEVVDSAGRDWTSTVAAQLMVITPNAGGAVSYAWTILSAGLAANRVRLTPPQKLDPTTWYSGGLGEYVPQVGDSYVLYTLTQFTGNFVMRQTIPGSLPPANGLRFGSIEDASFTTSILFDGGGFIGFTLNVLLGSAARCVIAGGTHVNLMNTAAQLVFSSPFNSPSIYGGGTKAAINPGFVSCTYRNGFIFQGVTLTVSSCASTTILDAMFFDWAAGPAIIVDTGGVPQIYSASGSSAVASTYGIKVKSGTVYNMSGGTWTSAFNLVGTASATQDFLLAGASSGAAYNAAAVPPVFTTVRTFTCANLDLTVAGGGFGGSVTSVLSAAAMVQPVP
jgi:hypothetical protein